MNDKLWDYMLNMCIASYINPDPDSQVRKMAKKYKKNKLNASAKNSLKKIIKSSNPSLLIKIAYFEILK